MPRFTTHAYVRYFLRQPGLPGGRVSMPLVERKARENFAQSQFISREEAIELVGPIAARPWNRYYRTDAVREGVWVTCWHKGEEVVITYLSSRTLEHKAHNAEVLKQLLLPRGWRASRELSRALCPQPARRTIVDP